MPGIVNFKIHPHEITLIKKEHIQVTKQDLDETADKRIKITVEIDQEPYDFAANSLVQIHLKTGDEQIFDLGTWGNIQQYTKEILLEFGGQKLQYLITVTEVNEDTQINSYRFIGRSSWCKPKESQSAKFFHTIKDNLGDVPWSYRFPNSHESQEMAALILNEDIDNILTLPSENELLKASMLTTFFREMLFEMIRQELKGAENEESWHFDIFQVCKILDEESSIEIISNDDLDERKTWAENLVHKWASTQEFVEKINNENQLENLNE